MLRNSLLAFGSALACALAFVLAAAATTAQPSPAATTFLFSGHGYGHGIGMSQYGAEWMAGQGSTYQQILQHFYPTTALGRAPVSHVRVQLAAGAKTLKFGSDQPFAATDADGNHLMLAAGQYKLDSQLNLTLDSPAPPPTPTTTTAAPAPPEQQVASPLTVSPGQHPLALDGHRYRGTFTVTLAGGTLEAVNTLSLESYLYGVVPGEMPSSWRPEALKAQAVAARSYAVSTRKSGGDFDLYSDNRSQMYLGIDGETPTATAAVKATAGIVVTFNGQPATTFFHASSGGKTIAIHDAWPASAPQPYLISVPDPGDVLSPYHNWGPVSFTAAQVAKLVGDGAPKKIARLIVNRQGGRTRSVSVVDAAGAGIGVSGSAFAYELGLRSTWFTVATLTLGAKERTLAPGAALVLQGMAAGAGKAWIEHYDAGTWTRVAFVRSGAAFQLTVHSPEPGRYRLSSALGPGPAVLVRISG